MTGHFITAGLVLIAMSVIMFIMAVNARLRDYLGIAQAGAYAFVLGGLVLLVGLAIWRLG